MGSLLTHPLFTADWVDVVFIHFSIERDVLQPAVPFELDTFEGQAYVSLVAFTQDRLRPMRGGRVGALLASTLARHEFLNLRTYVRVGEERGIYFIVEWIPNRLAALIGPRTYGLPYRLGRLRYETRLDRGLWRGDVSAHGGGRLRFRAEADAPLALRPASPGTLEHFLLERYVAYTSCAGVARSFKVAHAPWPHCRARAIELDDCSIVRGAGAWTCRTRCIAVHLSPGVQDVLIGAPQECSMRRVASESPAEFSCSPAGDRVESAVRSG